MHSKIQEVGEQSGWVFDDAPARPSPFAVDHRVVGRDEDDVGFTIKLVDLAAEPVADADIVGILPTDIFSPCQCEPAVEGVGDSGSLRYALDYDPGIALRPPLHDLGAIVSRAVIDNEVLEVGKILRQNALDGRFEVAFAVVHHRQDRELGIAHAALFHRMPVAG